MRFRNSIQKYDVVSHGSEYVEPVRVADVIPICPECYSSSVTMTKVLLPVTDKSNLKTEANYICNNCGCKYNAQIQEELTPVGEILCGIITILKALLMITAGVSYIYGLVIGAGREDTLMLSNCLCSMILCPAVCYVFIRTFSYAHRKITGNSDKKL